MKHKAKRNLQHGKNGRAVRRITAWVQRRRRIAARQFLCGACYGSGTAAVSLVVVWFQNRY